jgi:tRNA nucleotidyltransferase (CCA-adding enzyme)
LADLYWHLIACNIEENDLSELSDRLMFGAHKAESMHLARQLVTKGMQYLSSQEKPSTISQYLATMPVIAIAAAWIYVTNEAVRENIQKYWVVWRHIHPIANGHTLREMGLQPGPRFGAILKRLHEAWLDGEVSNPEEEARLLTQLVAEDNEN